MKKLFIISLFAILPLLVSGCSSNIVAKYNDYNETFTGKTYYNSLAYTATIDVISNKNNAHCIGNAHMHSYPMWQFQLTCSDGRAITGLLPSGILEGKAFTNRNELITFSVAKKQSTVNKILSEYQTDIKNAPKADNSKDRMQVIMH